MFTVGRRKKFGFIRLKEVCYAPEPNQDHEGYDAVYYFNCDKPYGRSIVQMTMLIDLSHDPDSLLMSFSKNTRAEIRKAIDNNRLKIHFSEDPELHEVEAFIQAYNRKFAAGKKVPEIHPYMAGTLKELQSMKRLIIANASAEGKTLCQFMLVNVNDMIVCLFAYNTRFLFPEDPETARFISRANRLLDYRSMLLAKSMGKRFYDMCGIKLTPDGLPLNNTDKYKFGFRGNVICTYDYIYPVTITGHIYSYIRAMIKSFNNKPQQATHSICYENTHRKENHDGLSKYPEKAGVHPSERHSLRSGGAGRSQGL